MELKFRGSRIVIPAKKTSRAGGGKRAGRELSVKSICPPWYLVSSRAPLLLLFSGTPSPSSSRETGPLGANQPRK